MARMIGRRSSPLAVNSYSGQQRRVSGELVYETGSFYNGDRQSIALNTGRVQVTPQVSLEPSFSINWVDLVQGAFTAKVRAPARLTRLDDFKPRNCVPTCRHCATAPS